MKEALSREPGLSNRIQYAVAVNDASVDAFSLTLSNIESARVAGASALNYQRVVRMKQGRGMVEEVHYQDTISGESRRIKPEIVVNAAGAWSARVAAMVQMPLPLTLDKGSMVVVDGRQTRGLLNRLRMPSDGDIIVPSHSVTILGTTSGARHSLEKVRASVSEIELLRKECSLMLPGLEGCRMVRSCARLVAAVGRKGTRGRDASRSFSVIDHSPTRIGQPWSTWWVQVDHLSAHGGGENCRLVVDLLGERAPCRTARNRSERNGTDPSWAIAQAGDGAHAKGECGPLTARVANNCRGHRGAEMACDCEEVLRGEISYFAGHPDVRTLSDIMRRTRAGMGYCQSSLCAFKILSAAKKERSEESARKMLEDFLAERRSGIEPVLEGEQLRQEISGPTCYRGPIT